ncbi:MAG TPA: ATP-binding protein [Myxococcota bacterium]|nr:ATP-binding protein [Myxococcota bacterium]HRY96725.1 ATP-binding protein [Myxococcota bacterium]HSA23941.1 ATP-binding protein [Myxococcota bacterium]
MWHLRKFEWKIVLALLVTAAAPLLFTMFMVERLVEESMAIGLNDQVLTSLHSGVGLYKEVIESRMRVVRLQGQMLSQDEGVRRAVEQGDREAARPALEALLEGSSWISRARLLSGGEVWLEVQHPEEFPKQAWKSKTDRWQLGQADDAPTLEVTFVIRRDFLAASEALRELVLTLEDVEENFQPWKLAYYRMFLLAYTVILIAAVLLGILLARGVTGRVARLVAAVHQASGGNLGVRVEVRSRDEIGQLTVAFNQMLDDLQRGRDRIVYLEKISSWQEIARRLAHEIKNPLTPIQLAVQELHRSYRGDDPKFTAKLSASVEIVEEEVGTLRRMVETFSAFAKMPAVQPQPAELNAFVADFLKLNPQFSGRVGFEPRAVAIPVRLDRSLMGRVLTNLINNGLEASPSDQRVELEVGGADGWGWLRVIDHGAGLSELARQRLFQPYFTTKEHGTGLGLAIVKKIVLQHGGEISAAEGVERGAVFTVRLPLEANRADDRARG